MTNTVTDNRAQSAIDYITSRCSTIGAFMGTTEPYGFIRETAAEMAQSQPCEAFPERYIEHVAYALGEVANNMFTSPPAAIASVYLATRFEYYFRVLSGMLNPDGTWVSSSAQDSARQQLNDNRLGKKRISSVSLTYKLLKLNASSELSKHLASLDAAVYSSPTTVCTGQVVADMGDRIEFGRHAVGHGHWGDISSEAVFYGLMTAPVFYSKA